MVARCADSGASVVLVNCRLVSKNVLFLVLVFVLVVCSFVVGNCTHLVLVLCSRFIDCDRRL